MANIDYKPLKIDREAFIKIDRETFDWASSLIADWCDPSVYANWDDEDEGFEVVEDGRHVLLGHSRAEAMINALRTYVRADFIPEQMDVDYLCEALGKEATDAK